MLIKRINDLIYDCREFLCVCPLDIDPFLPVTMLHSHLIPPR